MNLEKFLCFVEIPYEEEKRILVCIAGKNDIAVNVLTYLNSNDSGKYELAVVCNQNENGKNTWQKSLRWFARKFEIKEYRIEELYDIEDLIFLSIEFDKIVKTTKFKTKKLYNIHFSLLPAYKGMHTSVVPILNGEEYAGVSFHKIDVGIDTGDIIYPKKIKIEKDYTSRDLYLLCIKYGTELVINNLPHVLSDTVIAYPQSSSNSTYYSKKIH